MNTTNLSIQWNPTATELRQWQHKTLCQTTTINVVMLDLVHHKHELTSNTGIQVVCVKNLFLILFSCTTYNRQDIITFEPYDKNSYAL